MQSGLPQWRCCPTVASIKPKTKNEKVREFRQRFRAAEKNATKRTFADPAPDKSVTILRRRNRTPNLPPVKHCITHPPDRTARITIPRELYIRRNARPAGRVRVIRMRPVHEHAQQPPKLAEHVRTPQHLLARQRERQADDVDEVALDHPHVLQVCLRLLLRHRDGARALALDLLQLLAPLALLLRVCALFRLLRRRLRVHFRELEVCFFVLRPAGGALSVQLLADVVQAPETYLPFAKWARSVASRRGHVSMPARGTQPHRCAHAGRRGGRKTYLVAALARVHRPVGRVELLETQRARRALLFVVHLSVVCARRIPNRSTGARAGRDRTPCCAGSRGRERPAWRICRRITV